jgi:hypothetical protein
MKPTKEQYQEMVVKFNQSYKKAEVIYYTKTDAPDKTIQDIVQSAAFMKPDGTGIVNFVNGKVIDIASITVKSKEVKKPEPPKEIIKEKAPVIDTKKVTTKLKAEKKEEQPAKKETPPEVSKIDVPAAENLPAKVNQVLEVTAAKISALSGFSPEEVAVIKATVAKNTTNVELSYFLSVAKHVGLSPFNKEIWCYKDNKNNLIVFAGKDGLLRKAQEHPLWGGIRSCEVCSNDEFDADIPNGVIHHKVAGFGEKTRGQIIGSYAIIWRKDAEATIEMADILVYDKKGSAWNTHKADMIKKVSECHALKKAFGFAGIQIEDDWDIDHDKGTANPRDLSSPHTDVVIMRGDQNEAIELLDKCTSMSDEFRKTVFTDITESDEKKVKEIINLLTEQIEGENK